MSAKKTAKKKTAKKKTAKKKTAEKKVAKKASSGRPRSSVPNTTISFRVPVEAEAGFIKLADDETAKSPGRTIKVSEIYNQALAEFARERGIRLHGWNVPA